MASTIKIKRSSTASATPNTLEYGELGLNYTDGKLFYKNSSNNIVEFISSVNLAGTVYNATVGDGTNTSFVLTHNFGSRDLSITVREAVSPYGLILTSWEATSTNTITVFFDSPPALNSVRVSVYIAVAGLEQGPAGPTGPSGPTGAEGPTGSSGMAIQGTAPVSTSVIWADTSVTGVAVVPLGGTTGQMLTKSSGTDYDTAWSTPVTSSDLALKAPLASPTFTGIVTIPAGASISGFATLASPTFTGTVTLPSDTSIGTVSATEIGYVDGVTSAIQTQLNAKASTGKAIAMAIVFGG